MKELVINSFKKCGYVFEWWIVNWLGKYLVKEFVIELSDCYINCLLKKMGLFIKLLLVKIDEIIS